MSVNFVCENLLNSKISIFINFIQLLCDLVIINTSAVTRHRFPDPCFVLASHWWWVQTRFIGCPWGRPVHGRQSGYQSRVDSCSIGYVSCTHNGWARHCLQWFETESFMGTHLVLPPVIPGQVANIWSSEQCLFLSFFKSLLVPLYCKCFCIILLRTH